MHVRCSSAEFYFRFPRAISRYAVARSKIVTDMVGHLMPGGSYQLVKQWLQDMGSSPLVVPGGFISVGFDNEQCLLKNWLARGANRSQAEVLTNLLCAVHDESSSAQHDPRFHRRHWKSPGVDEIRSVFSQASDQHFSSTEAEECLRDYIQVRLDQLKADEISDKVSSFIEKQKREAAFLECPGCHVLMERDRRNCQNPECPVRNVREALKQNVCVKLGRQQLDRVVFSHIHMTPLTEI